MAYLIDGASTPTIVNSSVARTREYLTGKEIDKLMEAARKRSRHGHRDATMILIAYRHGLRASEVCDLQWHQAEINSGRLHVRRTKRGTPSVHPIQGDEVRALRRLQREQPGPYVFASECGGPIAPKSFHTLISRLGEPRPYGLPYSPAHATPRLRLCAGERRSRTNTYIVFGAALGALKRFTSQDGLARRTGTATYSPCFGGSSYQTEMAITATLRFIGLPVR